MYLHPPSKFKIYNDISVRVVSSLLAQRARADQNLLSRPISGPNSKIDSIFYIFQTGRLFICLFVCLFFVPFKNFSLKWRRHHCRWRAANFDQCSALMAIEQLGFFNVPHLLWHALPFIMHCHLRWPVTLTPVAERLAVSCHYLYLWLRSVERRSPACEVTLVKDIPFQCQNRTVVYLIITFFNVFLSTYRACIEP